MGMLRDIFTHVNPSRPVCDTVCHFQRRDMNGDLRWREKDIFMSRQDLQRAKGVNGTILCARPAGKLAGKTL